jgi:hypothetical protein
MKLPYLAVATIAFGLGAAPAFANDNGPPSSGPGASEYSPGDRMKDSSTSTAPGASEYAPGREMKKDKGTGPGASEYAPGDLAKDKTGGSASTGKSSGKTGKD